MPTNLDKYFKYHPPVTEERKEKHAQVNSAALAFAQIIAACVEDEECKNMAFFAVQQARMFANQGVTMDEISKQEDTCKV